MNASIGIQKCKMLHGDIKQSDREKIYRGFKSGEIQIIIATNVAEASVTIPRLKFVVDTGYAKVNIYDLKRNYYFILYTLDSNSNISNSAMSKNS